MKNIFASISWLDEIDSMGLPKDKYLAIRLRAFYQSGMNKGLDSDAAIKYAKERLKFNIEKPIFEKPVVEEKSVYMKDPAKLRGSGSIKKKTNLSEEEILDSRISTVNPKVKKLINLKLREIVGNVSDEEFVKVQALFKREKTSAKLTNRETLEEVIRITGKHKDVAEKKESNVESVPSNVSERNPHKSDFDTSEDYNLYDFVRSMDPSNAERNLPLFKKYRLQGYRVSTALDRIRKVGELREFCNVNNIPIELATRFINVYPNLEDVKRELLQWKREGGFGLETNVLPVSKSGTGIEANPVVDYQGRKVKLKRLIQSLYSDKLSGRELQMMYSTVYHNVFSFGKSLDEAIDYANKTLRMYRARNIFNSEFPEDPKYAESVFEDYYITENNSFEDAMRMTREQVGRKVVSSSLVRVAIMLEEDCYWNLSDKFMSYLSKRL